MSYKKRIPKTSRYPSRGSAFAQIYPSEGSHRLAEQSQWTIQNVISVSALIASVIAAIAAGLAFYESRRQADAAFVGSRAWIRVDPGEQVSVSWKHNLVTVNSIVKIQNIGNSPAQDASVSTILTGGLPPSKNEVAQKCASGDRVKRGDTLFLQEKDIETRDAKLNWSKGFKQNQDRQFAEMNLIVCATYRIDIQMDWHHTARVYRILKIFGDSRAEGVLMTPFVGENLLWDRTVLSKQYSNDYTD